MFAEHEFRENLSEVRVGHVRGSNDHRRKLWDYWHTTWAARSRTNRALTREVERIWSGSHFTNRGNLGALCAFAFTTVWIKLGKHRLHITEGVRSNCNGALGNQSHLFRSSSSGSLDDCSNSLCGSLGSFDRSLHDFARAARSGSNLFRDNFQNLRLVGRHRIFDGDGKSDAIYFSVSRKETECRAEQGKEDSFFHVMAGLGR